MTALCHAEVQIECPDSFELGTWVSSSADNKVTIEPDGIINAFEMDKYLSGARAGRCFIQDKSAKPGDKVEIKINAIALTDSIDLMSAECRYQNKKNNCYHKPLIIKLKDSRPHYFALGFTVNIKANYNATQNVLFQYSVDAKYQGSKIEGKRKSKT